MKRALVVLGASCIIAGCGGSDGTGGTGGGSGGGGGGALMPPDHGMQLASETVTLKSGEEKYLCWSIAAPSDGLRIVGLEYQTPGAGIHHYSVFTNSAPLPKNPSGYECSTMGITWGLVSGGGLGTPPVTFPAGTAMTIAADTQMILQLHLLNTTGGDLAIDPVRVNLDSAAPGTKLQEVGLIVGGTLDIDIPPHASNLEVKGGCEAPNAMEHIFKVFPHMHRLGRHISSTLTPAAGGATQMISDLTWNFSDQGLYDVKASAKAGDRIEVKCTYDNTSSDDVKFGLSTTDEMCLEVLYYWPATKPSQYCGF